VIFVGSVVVVEFERWGKRRRRRKTRGGGRRITTRERTEYPLVHWCV
jgi:hypothetical protein